MARKPYSIIIILLLLAPCSVFSKYHNDNTPTATSFRSGTAIQSRAVIMDGDEVIQIPAALREVAVTRAAQVNQSLRDQLDAVEFLTCNSIVTLAPVHIPNIPFTPLKPPYQEGLEAIFRALGAIKDQAGKTASPALVERLCAGLDLVWDKGQMGMASFVARGDDNFWSTTPYDVYKYWLVKGPHKDGDRFNFSSDPNHQLFTYGLDQKFRLENIARIGNLSVTDVKSPFAKIFEGTDSPCKDKYTVVNLAGVGSGVGSIKDNWACLTGNGGLMDVSLESSGTKYVLKNRSITLKNDTRALAMPLYHQDMDPDYGVGVQLKDESGWTTANSGPSSWSMDLGQDRIVSVGGSLDQGGLINSYPAQHMTVYLLGSGDRAYINPGQNMCIDTHHGNARNWLPAPDGWMRTTGEGRAFEWPGDGADGVGRVNLGNYLSTMFPAAYKKYDQGLSLWNGQPLFRFKASRIKGGACCNTDCDYGVFVTLPIGGLNFPTEVPWIMPKVKGMPDGMFDTTSGIESVSEVSARVGDAAISAIDHVSHGITKWKFASIYPYPVIARCAGRYDGITKADPKNATSALVGADAVGLLSKFFGQHMPPMIPPPANITSMDSSNICYGAMAKLQHKESGQYLTISNYALPSDPGGFYLTCTPDSSAAGWWMVAPGKDLAARAGGVALTGGEGIRLVERNSKKVLVAVDVLPPISTNYVAASDSEITPATLGKYNMVVAAYGGPLPASTVPYSPANWVVDAAYTPTGTSPDVIKRSGIQLQNQGFGGYLSSVNGYRFQPATDCGDWVQEVTVFDSGTNHIAQDVGDFGTWMLADYVPAPSTHEDMNNAGFEGPLTSFDGKVFTLVQVAMGTDGCIYGVDGAQNAVKIDLAKKTQEQIATGIKQIAIGTDDALIMLKVDGTVVLRPPGGADTVVPGCMGRFVAIGNATTFAACSADGSARDHLGHLMLNESNQLLARDTNGSTIDITDDGYVYGIQPSAVPSKSRLALWKKSSSAKWNHVSLDGLDQEVARVSAGSSRFVALHGHHGGLFILDSNVGADIFSNPDQLLTDNTKLTAPAWQRVTIDGTVGGAPIIVADSAMSSNGDLAVLAGQVNDNFEFPIFTKSFAPWPKETDVFNLRVEKSAAVAASAASTTQAAVIASPASYSKVLVCDNQHGYLKESKPLAGATLSTQDVGTTSQFSMASLDGYVTLQAKSAQAMANSNSVVGLKKDDKLQNKNLMVGKGNNGIALASGSKLDITIVQDELAVGFGGEKFKAAKDPDSILEKFMFYALPLDASGALRFKLQSKATGGYLKLDESTNSVVSISNNAGIATPIPVGQGSVFVVSSVSSSDLKLQQGLIGKNPRDAMTVIETAFVDEKSYGQGVEGFFKNVLHWLDGVRISPDGWIDFTQTKSDWVDPVDKLKKSVTASERLAFMVDDASVLSNPILQPIFVDPANPAKVRRLTGVADTDAKKEACTLLQTIRDESDPTNAPTNLGLLKNVKDGSVVALRSTFGIDSNGCLTTNKASFVSELYVSVDLQRNVVRLARTTSIDPNVQFHMKVVPSPLASAQNVDSGHNSADVQRWMMQGTGGTDATVKRIFVPTLPGGTIDSQASALEKIVLQFGVLPDTSASTLLPAYFDVDTIGDKLNTQIAIQSASDSGYWALGQSEVAANVVKAGLSVIDSTTNDLKVDSVLDLDIRTLDVSKSGDGTYGAQPVVGAHSDAAFSPAVFEIVVITPVMSLLTAAFKKATFDDQASDFLTVSKQLEKTVDAVTFCEAVTSFIKQSVRNSQSNWNAFVGNRAARDKLAQAITSVKQLFADDYGAAQSNIKQFVDGLAKVIDVSRVPSFGVTKSRADLIVDLQTQIKGLSVPGGLDKFVTAGAAATFISNLQRGVNDWFTSVGIAVSDAAVQNDGVTLATIITDYKNAIGTSLSKIDSDTLNGLSLTLTNSTTLSNPIDILQGIVTANTISGVVTFGSDAKYSFLSKLWELYKSSTLDPDSTVTPVPGVIQDGKIVSRGDVFGLTPAQLTQLSNVLISVSKAPSGPSAPGGPFFGDDATGDVRGGVGNDAWGWKDQPFGAMTNTQIINQLAVLFVAPTFSAFVTAYLQYLAANQDNLTNLATSIDLKDQAQVQRFALRLITLAEQWNTWKKGATPRLQRQELNQFKSLIRSVKSFVRSNVGLKQRTDKLLAVVQSAIDQLV